MRSIPLFPTLLLATAFTATNATAQQGERAKEPRPIPYQQDVHTTPRQPQKTVPATGAAPTPRSTSPRPGKSVTSGGEPRRTRRVHPEPSGVLFDRPGDGALWATADRYKARFDASGALYVPFLGSTAARNLPVHFTLDGAVVAGERVAVDAEVRPVHDGRRVSFDRGAVVERFDLSADAMEQSFAFRTLPRRGDIVLTVTVDAAAGLTFSEDAQGFRFAGADGGVTYGRATAVDANGRRLQLDSEYTDGRIRIRVPASFVAEAALPLVVDPLIGTEATISDDALTELNPDLSYDVSTDRWLYVWERIFSATDHDVWCAEYDASNSFITGTLDTIDVTTDTWQRPKVANNNLADRHLVVCQVSGNASPPYRIEGRTVDAGSVATRGNQFTIADASVSGHFTGDKITPDVGGDPHTVGPTYFTVVWERVFSSSDSDIHAKQVTNALDPSLRSASPIVIDNSSERESNPAISNSDGMPPSTSQTWHIAYQRRFNSSDEDIRGATLTWDGQLGSPANFSVDASVASDQHPTVSAPTDGQTETSRHVLYAYDRHPRTQPMDRNIQGRVVDNAGSTASPSIDLSALDNSPTPSWGPLAPAVDSDGCRFAVMYEELYSGSGSDWDTRVSTFHFNSGSGTLALTAGRETAGYSGSAERDASVFARHSGGGEMLRYGFTWVDDRGSDNDAIEGQLYDGHTSGGGFSTATGFGCGGISIGGSGTPAIGHSITVSVSSSSGPAVQVWGTSVSPLPVCGPCRVAVSGALLNDPVSLRIPCQAVLVGTTVSVQGADLVGGPCSPLRLTDRLDIQVR